MANIDNNSEKNDKQGSDFAKAQELKSNVYEAIEEQLKDSTEKAFKSEGVDTRKQGEQKGEQGWNRGVYGDGSTYGTGTAKGQAYVTVNRNKGSKATNSFFEKNLSYGGKKMVIEIHVDIDMESKTIDMTYKTTEQAAFRGFQDSKGPFMINDKLTLDIDNISSFKSDLKKAFDKFAEKEANYFIKTKLGIEDRTEKSINSMVESNMKKLSLTDIINGNFNDTLDKIMESTKKEDKVEKNSPEVIAANSPSNLLFDDLEEAEEKHGKDYRDYFEKRMKQYGASSPDELKASEWKSINMDWKSKDEKSLDEISSVGGAGSVGAFRYDAPFGGGKMQKKKFADTPYSQKDKKRTLKREHNENGGWTKVELEPGSGYVPKGMNKNFALGLHGVDVNSEEENKLADETPRGRAGMAGKAALGESFNPSKRKFISEAEHKELGVNKRYIITPKKTADEESDRWKRLAGFQKNETIKLAESCGCPTEDSTSEKMVTREQGEEMNKKEFMKRNNNVDHGDEIGGRAVVVVPKPNSLTNATYKVFEDDYLNEGKAFIFDMNTGVLVNNPNYKSR
jgi:hypothetical protein